MAATDMKVTKDSVTSQEPLVAIPKQHNIICFLDNDSFTSAAKPKLNDTIDCYPNTPKKPNPAHIPNPSYQKFPPTPASTPTKRSSPTPTVVTTTPTRGTKRPSFPSPTPTLPAKRTCFQPSLSPPPKFSIANSHHHSTHFRAINKPFSQKQISALELARVSEAVLAQVDWEEVVLRVGANRRAGWYRGLVRGVLQDRVDEMVGKENDLGGGKCFD